MDAARIASLLSRFLGDEVLSEQQLSQLSAYLDLLMHWNQRINLTAVRDAEHIVTRHFGESLFAARMLLPRSAASGRDSAADIVTAEPPLPPRSERPSSGFHVNDIGSGAGFPGLPLKIYAPEIALTLIESNQKKATFLKEVVRTLRLMSVNVFAGRAESFKEPADLVTMRAVERFDQTLPIAASQVAPGGSLGLLIGDAQRRDAERLAIGFKWETAYAVPLSDARVLLRGRKLG
jgi:16S rRNA (guanine527-N7)-methyltransferase